MLKMSNEHKNIIQRIEELENVLKTEELNVANLLQNGWEQYNCCQIFKQNKVVHVNLCIRRGTTSDILELPEGFRPTETLFFVLTATGGDNTNMYGSVSKSGKISCSSANIGKLMMMNFAFKVN